MWLLSLSVLFLCSPFIINKDVYAKPTRNNSTILISKYAKVAHWGVSPDSSSENIASEGRSNTGQSLWTQRSDVKISQNSKPSVIYAYPQKMNTDKSDNFPSVGEVQERFQPRPYFSEHSSSSDIEKTNGYTSFDNFPTFNNAQSGKPSASTDNDFPPSSSSDTYGPPPAPPAAPQDSYGPPSGSSDDDSYGPPPQSDNVPKSNPTSGPPLAPNKDENIYYPPSDNENHQEIILDHPPPGYEDSKSNIGDMPDMMQPHVNMNSDNMAEQDLAPPPSANYDNQFPGYLYNDPHGHGNQDYFDHHHIYKEVTTTPAPGDERVNKGHYSYYYLGRKLWYVPLYFSVYFIVYVFVLILKSIARHKIQFKHNFPKEHGRQAKSMNFNEEINDIHRNVSSAIDTAKKRFVYVAM